MTWPTLGAKGQALARCGDRTRQARDQARRPRHIKKALEGSGTRAGNGISRTVKLSIANVLSRQLPAGRGKYMPRRISSKPSGSTIPNTVPVEGVSNAPL